MLLRQGLRPDQGSSSTLVMMPVAVRAWFRAGSCDQLSLPAAMHALVPPNAVHEQQHLPEPMHGTALAQSPTLHRVQGSQ